jgi:hypothetical protein
LRAMMPDLPMPVTMTRPVQPCSRSTRFDEAAVQLGISSGWRVPRFRAPAGEVERSRFLSSP